MRYLKFTVCTSLLLVACGSADVPQVVDGEGVSSEPVQVISSSSTGFKIVDGSPRGEVHVRGYAETEIVIEPFCDEDFCPEYEYVFFHVLESDNAEFDAFISQYGGNAFGSDNRIGLGCVDDNIIVYENDSDQYGRKEFVLSEDVSEEILDATAEHSVSLKLTKLPLSGGAGAPACYAHFTTVELSEE